MNFKNKLFTSAMVILVFIGLTAASSQIVAHADPCASGHVATIDLFTQKAPFDGRGPIETSDMYGPQETVELYASVTVNDALASGKLVTFETTGPTGTSKEIRFYLEAETNTSGVAKTQFTLQIINQTDVFGTWIVIASVDVNGTTYSDRLTFKVGWIIEFVSIRTLDENLSDREYFGKNGYVGVEIAVRNNAWVEKNATIEATLFDVAHVPIDIIEIQNFTVPPNGKTWYIYNRLSIKSYALVTNATIVAVALDSKGTAYCPEISTTFWVTILNPVYPNFVDASVYLGYLPRRVEPGQLLTIPVVARNEGTVTLTNLNVSLHVNNSLLDSEFIDSLDPYAQRAFYATWNTSGLADGNYTINANVQTFPHEADLSDNSYTATVQIGTAPPIQICIHDIRVANVTCSKNEVYQGETVDIEVTVRNDGNFTESTSVGAYYNSTIIQEENVTELAPATERVLLFQWNTTSVPEGTYEISATANPVMGQTNFEHLKYTDGSVKIKSPTVKQHDVAMTDVNVSSPQVYAGETAEITVEAANLGDFSETFNVTVYYDSNPIQAIPVISLSPHSSKTITVEWNTTNVNPGAYTISANATIVEGDINPKNNNFIDGKMTIISASGSLVPYWVLLILFLGLAVLSGVAVLMLLLIYGSRRRKRKARRVPRYVIVTHPHI
jgi:hypothetical protein